MLEQRLQQRKLRETLMFRHPSYYKKLRASLREKAISPDDTSTDGQGRAPKVTSSKPQASSNKHKSQATSNKPQASED